MIKKKFQITGMHCTSCAMTIDMDLEDLEGITNSNTSYTKAETEVEFDPEKVKEDQIVQIIKKAGYEVSSE